jgi:muramoyltetrapeptide carboxypeptidase
VTFAYPPPLAPGDRVAVVAPSSPFEQGEFWRGLAWVRDRYVVSASPGVLERHGFLAGTDARRARELRRAMTEPEVKAIVCARGGYGAMRLLADLPWEAFASAPKWLVGFSDVTALHIEAQARGIASVHAPHVTGLAGALPLVRAAWLAALERPGAAQTWAGLTVVHGGVASGPLVGGNLAILAAMSAAGRLKFPEGAILALEDVTERPYRLDRMLTSLRLAGHLSGLAGIVLGGFTACDPGADGVSARDVLAERTLSLGVPVVAGAPFGHGATNLGFVLGARARIEGDAVRIGF